MKGHYTIQCVHPETQKTGCWIFSGDNHRTPGTSLSPLFSDLTGLFRWMHENGWHTYGVLECKTDAGLPD